MASSGLGVLCAKDAHRTKQRVFFFICRHLSVGCVRHRQNESTPSNDIIFCSRQVCNVLQNKTAAKKMSAAPCSLDEIPVVCEESLASLMARIGKPTPHRDACTGRSCVNPLDNLRNQVAVQKLDSRVGTLYTRPKTCAGNPSDPLTDPFVPSPSCGPQLSSPMNVLPRAQIRANLSTPSFRGISGVSFARLGDSSTASSSSATGRVGGVMIVGTTNSQACARVGRPGFMY